MAVNKRVNVGTSDMVHHDPISCATQKYVAKLKRLHVMCNVLFNLANFKCTLSLPISSVIKHG